MRNHFTTPLLSLAMLLSLGGCHAEKPRVIVSGTSGDIEIEVEVATTEAEKIQGLMGRESLADGRGMVFVYSPEATHVMWMRNMLIPLDMVFIGKDMKIRYIETDVPPCREPEDQDCPRYGSTVSSAYVLELPAGYTKKEGIRQGDTVRLVGIQ